VRDRIASLNSFVMTRSDKRAFEAQRSTNWDTAFVKAFLRLPICLFKYLLLAGFEDVHIFFLSFVWPGGQAVAFVDPASLGVERTVL